MLKLPIEEFIEEIKAEISSYEDLGEEKALEWEKKFLQLSEADLINKKICKNTGGNCIITIADESELFQYADNYWASIDSDEENKYWEGFK